jgi:peptidoglycan/LPS O-acetylase OafA/YrhL
MQLDVSRRVVLAEKRVYFFDGLRGWAAIVVMLCHIRNTFPELMFISRTPLRLFTDGAFAVYIFFVLSGIVLSIGYMRHQNISSLASLAIKRIPRLSIPILISCVLLVPLMKLGLFHNIEAAYLEGGNDWLAGFYAFDGNFLEAVKFSIRDVFFYYGTVNSYNSSLWTMTWEVFGSYLVVVVLLCSKCIQPDSKKAKLFWTVLFLYMWCLNIALFAFMLGITVSYIYVNKQFLIERIQKSLALQILLILLTICAYLGSGLFSMLKIWRLQSTMYSISAFFLVLAIIVNPALQKIFSMKLSRFLGKISFPLYIVHVPIICTLTSYLIVHYGYNADNNNLIIFFVITAITSIITACIFYPAEKLSINVSNKISKAIIRD